MSIKGNLTSGLISLASGDNTVLENTTTTRWVVTSVKVHDYGATGETIGLFISANAVSASAERIDDIVTSPDDTLPSAFAPFVLSAGEFLLANAGTGSTTNIEAVYTAYTGDS